MKRFLLALTLLAGYSAFASAQPLAVAQAGPLGLSGTTCVPGASSTATSCLLLNVTGLGTASVSISGTYSGTITFTGSNGGPYVNVGCTSTAAGSAAANTTTSTGTFICPVAGLRILEANITSYSSGTAVVWMLGAPGGGAGGGAGSSTATIGGTVTVAGADAAGAPSAGTVLAVQGISGGTAQPMSASALPLPTGAATAAKQPALGTAGTPATDILTVQGNASGTAIPISNLSLTNLDTDLGATADAAVTGDASGSVNAHLRFLSKVFNDIWDSANHRANIAVLNGSTTDTDDGSVANNATSVAQTISVLYGFDGTNNIRIRAKTSAPASSDAGLFTRPFLPTDGTNLAVFDPCESSGAVISSIAISQTASTAIKAGTSSKKTYVCGIFVQADDAEKLSLVGGTGTVCGTTTVALIGATTAANGASGAANGGWVLPVSKVAWTNTTVNADDLCLLQSGSGRVAGVIKVAVQ